MWWPSDMFQPTIHTEISTMFSMISLRMRHGQTTQPPIWEFMEYSLMKHPAIIRMKAQILWIGPITLSSNRQALVVLTLYYPFWTIFWLQIVHNPGTIPNDLRFFFGADLIVLFDGEYSDFISGPQAQHVQSVLEQLPSQNINGYQRQNFSYIFNGAPPNWSTSDMQNFVNKVNGGAEWLFITDTDLNNNGSNYQTWGSDWSTFAQVMASS